MDELLRRWQYYSSCNSSASVIVGIVACRLSDLNYNPSTKKETISITQLTF